jgi:hypothetical protein
MHQARATSQRGKQGEGDQQYTVCPHGSESGEETKGDGSARQTQVRVEVLGVWAAQVSAKHTSVGAHGALALEELWQTPSCHSEFLRLCAFGHERRCVFRLKMVRSLGVGFAVGPANGVSLLPQFFAACMFVYLFLVSLWGVPMLVWQVQAWFFDGDETTPPQLPHRHPTSPDIPVEALKVRWEGTLAKPVPEPVHCDHRAVQSFRFCASFRPNVGAPGVSMHVEPSRE